MNNIRVTIIGSSIAGTAAALFFSRLGHDVTILEREEAHYSSATELDWAAWSRAGVPHAVHSHTFLPKLVNMLQEHAPEALNTLLNKGCEQAEFKDYAKLKFGDFLARPDDTKMTLLKCRRYIFENEARNLVVQSGVKVIHSANVLGIVCDQPGKVSGVKVRIGNDDTNINADLVVDASGRRSQCVKWLAEHGITSTTQIDESCGIFYTTQWFKLKDTPYDESLIETYKKQITGCSYYESSFLGAAMVFADNGYFSITLTAQKDDLSLRKLTRLASWMAVVKHLPGFAPWVDERNVIAQGNLKSFGNMDNIYHPLIDNNQPLLNGLVNIGDALCTLNPAAGRGCTIAWITAYEIAKAVSENSSITKAITEYYQRISVELESTIQASVRKDRNNISNSKDIRDGIDPFNFSGTGKIIDNGHYIGTVMDRGLSQASETDIDLYRKLFQVWFLLEKPDVLVGSENFEKAKAGYEIWYEEHGKHQIRQWKHIVALLDQH
ncbi:hypothetical protein PSECIP111951_03993 [Pseudoalteromonas holothuriae]|uniref:FAD-dependent oxidoreductase 2 FAD-binding domain-containing protein n=1 Tax=Pseudoalteromonas holothuriae TaxID=2963714 RepID=A0A9W4W3H8_9GAMM|nr:MULTISPECIES: FAD-dependent monooxygenase [unclassified Pseudoalteromonas]CAH9066891.1 hypothetical protein PSECIP111854_03981 [Pseudoalteromonas sp. CIP111854]CAH9068051.1 hypothetical protein PSECIP111951_03993 [Pseudoalteromonas sp. CIP111951]